MTTMSAHANYLRDLGDELRRRARAARDEARAKPGDAFAQGQAHAFHAVLSLMQHQAEGYALPLHDLALDGLDADRELL